MYDALQVLLLFVYVTRNTADVTFYINSLTSVFSKPVLKLSYMILLNYKKANWFYWEFCEIFKRTYFVKQLRAAVSG